MSGCEGNREKATLQKGNLANVFLPVDQLRGNLFDFECKTQVEEKCVFCTSPHVIHKVVQACVRHLYEDEVSLSKGWGFED